MVAKEIGLRPPLNSYGIAKGRGIWHYVWAIHRYIYTKDVCLTNDQGIYERRLLKKNNYTSTPVAKTVLVVLPAPPTRGKRSIPFPEI